MKKIICIIVLLLTSISGFSQYQILRWKAGSNSIDFSQPASLSTQFPGQNSSLPINENPVGYSLITNDNGVVEYYVDTDNRYFDNNTGQTDLSLYGVSINQNRQAVMLVENSNYSGMVYTSNDALYLISSLNDISNLFPENLATNVCPKVIGYYNSNTSYYKILTHKLNSKEYDIIDPFTKTETLITGQIRYGGLGSETDTGFFKISPDNLYFAASYPARDTIEFSKFNNPDNSINLIIDGQAFNAIEFAPLAINGKVILYAATDYDIYQIVIDTNDFSFYDTIKVVHSDVPITDLQLGVDGKIYVAKLDTYIGVIQNPNVIGNCSYDAFGFYGGVSVFPNFPSNYFINVAFFLPFDNQIIVNRPAGFTCYGPQPDSIISWNVDGLTISTNSVANYIPHNIGLHSLEVFAYWKKDSYIWDSIHLEYPFYVKADIQDTLLCKSHSNTVTLECPYLGGYQYIWSKEDQTIIDTVIKSNLFAVSDTGIWYVEVYDFYNNPIYYDTLTVATVVPIIEGIENPDTVMSEENLYLMANYDIQPFTAIDIEKYLWYHGDTLKSDGLNFEYTPSSTGWDSITLKILPDSLDYSYSFDTTYRFYVKGQTGNIPDTVLCDTLGGVNLIAPLYTGAEYIWKSVFEGITNSDTLLTNEYWVYHPGVYYLAVASGTDTVYRDTVIVWYFETQIYYQTGTPSTINATLGDTVDLSAILNIEPTDTNRFPNFNYSWIVDGMDTDSTLYTFTYYADSTGIDTIILNIFAESCLKFDTLLIYVDDAVSSNLLNIHDTTICDTNTAFILSIPSDYAGSTIDWYLKQYNYIATNTTTIYVNLPGTYYVYVNMDGTIIEDSCIVRYDLCENINPYFTINNDTFDTCQDNTELSLEGTYDVMADECGFTDDMRDLIWDFDDGSYGDGLWTNKTYQNAGNYQIGFYVFDAKGCEHHIKRGVLIASQNSNDTLVLSDLPQNTYGQYIIDVDSLNVFPDTVPAKRYFNIEVNQRLMPGFKTSFTFNVLLNKDTLLNPEEIRIGLNIAAEGFNLDLLNPNNDTLIRASFATTEDTTLLFGFPAFDYYYFHLSIPQQYFITGNGYGLSDFIATNNDTGRVYYSPDGYVEKFGLYSFVPPLTAFAFDSVSSNPTFLNGQWTIDFSYNGYFYGMLNSIEVYFPNNIGQFIVTPDSLLCEDEFGNSYKTNYEKKLYINSYGKKALNLSCKAFYDNCVKEKNMRIEFDNIPNTFTPNGDGMNDNWQPVSPEVNAEITIIDKNGTIVTKFNTKDKPEGWDGNYDNGKPAPNDSYWAIIRFPNEKISKKVVNLIR